jgi:hypothetical protein
MNLFVNIDATLGEMIGSFTHVLVPADTAIQIPGSWRVEQTTDGISASQLMKYRINEAEFHVLAEYLEFCNMEELPYKAVETLGILAADSTPRASIHKNDQLRIANGVVAVFANRHATELLNPLLMGVS